MRVIKRSLDFLLVAFLSAGLYFLYFSLVGRPGVFEFQVAHVNLLYFSLSFVAFVFIFVFGLGAYIYLLTGQKENIYSLVGLAEAEYFFASLVLLVGIVRWFAYPTRPIAREPLWLSFLLFWSFFGCWFWLLKTIDRPHLRLTCSALYGLLITFNFPLVLTAFSYFLDSPTLPLIGVKDFSHISVSILLTLLVYLRFYLHFRTRSLP